MLTRSFRVLPVALAALALAGIASAEEPSIRAAREWSPNEATAAEHNQVLRRYCMTCHNDRMQTGNLSLTGFDAGAAESHPDVAEKVIRKLRLGMMPPPGARRPEETVLADIALSLEARMDQAAADQPNPGRRSFQRLNRAEYSAAVRDLLALPVDGADYLPQDTISANFDNIADVQLLSATLMDSYLRAASEISRLAVGDPRASAEPRPATTCRAGPLSSSGSRARPTAPAAGSAVEHNFPADGEYVFRVSFHHETTGADRVRDQARSAPAHDREPEQDRGLHRRASGSRSSTVDPLDACLGPGRREPAHRARLRPRRAPAWWPRPSCAPSRGRRWT